MSSNPKFADPHLLKIVNRFMRSGADRGECERVLARISSYSDWAEQWFTNGAKWEQRARESEVRGHFRTARDFYIQAFFGYRIGEFAIYEDTGPKRRGYSKVIECFRKITQWSSPPIEHIEVPCDGQKLPGYISLPKGQRGAVPLLVWIYGADGVKEDHWFTYVKEAYERGIACVVVDRPGGGESLRLRGVVDRPDSEVLVASILDFLASRSEIDMKRVAVAGSSMGGYYAPRAAAFEKRIQACVCSCALYNALEGLFDPYPPIRPNLMYNAGAKTEEQAREIYRNFSLQGVAELIRCPCLILHGALDRLIPVSQAYQLYEAIQGPKQIRIWDDGVHSMGNYATEVRALTWDWLEEKLK